MTASHDPTAHREFAAQANNQAWTLCEKPHLTSDEQTELLHAAHAAAWHWAHVGTASERAHADLLVGRAHTRLGQPALAIAFASKAYAAIVSHSPASWEVAFAHAVLAGAGALAGDDELHRTHYALAHTLGERLDSDERMLFTATFRLIPTPG